MTIHTFNFDKKEKLMGMTTREKITAIRKYWEEHPNQCTWTCPVCGTQCGGVEGHSGPHQCKYHHEKGISFKDLQEAQK